MMISNNYALSTKKVLFIFAVVFLFAYSPAYLTSYAYTDDWTNLYWANTDRLRILEWDVLSGRPLYGLIQYSASFLINTVEQLAILRSISLLTALFAGIYIYKLTKKYVILDNNEQRITFSLLLCLLPSFQVYIAWASCSAYITAILLAGFSYNLSIKKNKFSNFLAGIILTLSFCIYQPAAMSFTFFACLNLCFSQSKICRRSLIVSTIVLGCGMLTSLIISKFLPTQLYDHTLSRADFTSDVAAKITWFFTEYLNNVICNFDLGAKILSVIISLVIIGFGLRKIRSFSSTKFYLVFILLLISALPNLIIGESSAAYRTIIASSLISTSVFILGLFEITKNAKSKKIIYITLLIIASFLARNHLIEGYSVPAQKEFELLNSEITANVPPTYKGEVYYRLTDEYLTKVATLRKYDDFGGLALGMPWTFQGMAYFVKEKNKMGFNIPSDPIIPDKIECPKDCIIIDSRKILNNHS